MSKNTTDAQESTDPRPRYVPLGTDGAGAHHVYATRTETVHVVADGGRVYRQDVTACGPGAWMTHVADRRGWATVRYAGDAGGALAASTCGVA